MLRRSPSPAMVIACLALFVALGGTGYAASGALNDGGGTAVVAKRHRSLRGPRGFRGPRGLTGATGPTGPTGPQGPAGTARAFAEVGSDARVVPGHASNIVDANITNPSRGIYCFDLSGIGINALNSVPLASPDYSDGATASGDTVQVVANTTFNTCPSGQVAVRTYDSTGAFSAAGFTIAFM